MDVADESAPMLSDWYSRLFSASWIEYVIDSLPDGQTDREAAFLAEKLPLETDSCVLDIGSGTGRHSVRLMQRGVRTIGIDLSAECLRRACRDAMDSASPCTFVRADMRMLPFRSEMFSHAICLFTSFGYFGSAQGDEAIVAEIARCLRPNGSFVLDVVNPLLPMRNHEWRNWTTCPDGEGYVLEESRYDALSGRSNSCRRVIRGSGVIAEFRQSIRIYSLAELNGLLTFAGFIVEGCWGDLTGSAYCPETSTRLVLIARRSPTRATRS